MLRKLKRLLVVGVAALSIAFAVPAISQATGLPCSSCDDAVASPYAEGLIGPYAVEDDHTIMGFAQAGGNDLILTASADAQGKNQYFLWWKVDDGYANAEAHINEFDAGVRAIVISNGVKTNGGLSFTTVIGTGTLEFDASALAQGNFGCLQTAEVALSGEFGTNVGGMANSYVDSIPGAFSLSVGSGVTTVGVEASDSDSKRFDFWFIFPIDPLVEVDIDGKVKVTQGLLLTAYTSRDGTTTANLGIISGGTAKAYGDASLTGISASGMVSQEAQAIGPGAYAYGRSMAAYIGAGGDITQGRRGTEVGQANGLAIVTGYNNVTNTGNHVSVTSHQTAYATTK